MAYRSEAWNRPLETQLDANPSSMVEMGSLGNSLVDYLFNSLNEAVYSVDQLTELSLPCDFAALPETFSGGDLKVLLQELKNIAQEYQITGTPFWELTKQPKRYETEIIGTPDSMLMEVLLVKGMSAKIGKPADFTAQELSALFARQIESYIFKGGLGNTDPLLHTERYREFASMLMTAHPNDVFVMVKKVVDGKLLILGGGRISCGDSTETLGSLNEKGEASHLSTLRSLHITNLDPNIAEMPANRVATIGSLFRARTSRFDKFGLKEEAGKISQLVLSFFSYALKILQEEAIAQGKSPLESVIFDTEIKEIWDYFKKSCGLIPLAEMENGDWSQVQVRPEIAAHRVLGLHYDPKTLKQLFAGMLPISTFEQGGRAELAKLDIIEVSQLS